MAQFKRRRENGSELRAAGNDESPENSSSSNRRCQSFEVDHVWKEIPGELP